MGKIPVLIIFGPTASGKTSLAGRLFSSDASSVFAGSAEIISADSMQVYRGMDISTAKADAALLSVLPHHLLNICEPSAQFTAGEFVHLADEACADIANRGKLPVIVGGTAFYIRNFMYGLPVTPESNTALRGKLLLQLQNEGAAAMYARLVAADPERAAKIHEHDAYRILRALEIFETSGRPLADFAIPDKLRPMYDFCVIALERPREELFRRINERAEQMVHEGLAEEFKRLIAAGFVRSDPGMQAIGCREFFLAADKLHCNPEDADISAVIALIQSDSRKYAKRQMTFFKAVKDACWFSADDEQAIVSHIEKFYKNYVF